MIDSSTDRTAKLAAALIGTATLAIVPMAEGVAPGDCLLFVAYELGLVLLPGVLLYVALTGRAGLGLGQVVVGGALGLVIEIGFFALTAALDARGALPALQIATALAALPFAIAAWRAQRPALDRSRLSNAATVATLALVLTALFVVADRHFPKVPLPEDVVATNYHPDIAWELALAAEARGHFPLQVPTLAGEPLRYHYFAALNEAAIGQVTGIAQPVVNFRLYLVPLLMLAVAGIVVLGREVGGSPWVGVLAGILVLFVGSPETLPDGLFLRNLYLSDTFLLGLVLFLALLVELTAKLRPDDGVGGRGTRGDWAVVLLLLGGCAGAKGSILPVVVCGLAIALAFAIWRRLVSARMLAIALATSLALLLASILVLYGSSAGDTLDLVLFAPGRLTEQYVVFARSLPDVLPDKAMLALVGSALANLEILAPLTPGLLLLGILYSRRLPAPAPVIAALLMGLLAASLAVFNVLFHASGSQYYFLFYGYAAAAVASAVGLYSIHLFDRSARRPVLLAAVASVAVLAIASFTDRPFSHEPRRFEAYSGSSAGLTADLYESLTWIRDNTPTDAVIAVNNQYSDRDHRLARACGYPAFAERRQLLGCEYGSSEPFPSLRELRAGCAQHPQPERFRLGEAIFERGSRSALGMAERRYGVTYLVADRLHSLGTLKLKNVSRLGRTVFANDAAVVVAVGGAG